MAGVYDDFQVSGLSNSGLVVFTEIRIGREEKELEEDKCQHSSPLHSSYLRLDMICSL